MTPRIGRSVIAAAGFALAALTMAPLLAADLPVKDSEADLKQLVKQTRDDVRELRNDIRGLRELLEKGKAARPAEKLPPDKRQSPRPTDAAPLSTRPSSPPRSNPGADADASFRLENAVYAFLATWCGPCNEMRPLLNQLKNEQLPVVIVDIDQRPDLAKELDIQTLPTSVLVLKGKARQRVTGLTSESQLRTMLREALSPIGSDATAAADRSLESPQAIEIQKKKWTFDCDHRSISEFASEFASKAGVAVVVDARMLEAAVVDGKTRVSLRVKNITWDALRRELHRFGLECQATGPFIVLSAARLEVRTYQVAGLIVDGSDQRGKPNFGELTKLIVNTIAPESWQVHGGPAGTIHGYDTTLSLIVRQTADVHEQIRSLLETMRRQDPSCVQLDMIVIENAPEDLLRKSRLAADASDTLFVTAEQGRALRKAAADAGSKVSEHKLMTLGEGFWFPSQVADNGTTNEAIDVHPAPFINRLRVGVKFAAHDPTNSSQTRKTVTATIPYQRDMLVILKRTPQAAAVAHSKSTAPGDHPAAGTHAAASPVYLIVRPRVAFDRGELEVPSVPNEPIRRKPSIRAEKERPDTRRKPATKKLRSGVRDRLS